MSNNIFNVEQLKTRLDKFLAEQLPGVSRGHIQNDIEAGVVKVNGEKQIVSKFVVRAGDSVEYTPSEKNDEVKAKNIPLKVLYNNHGLLIIDKPAGLAVHPGAGFKGDSLAAALLFHFKDIHLVGEEGRNGIVHRLDKDTSGVMMVALTPVMYDHLKDSFAERKVKKEYLALVKGKIENQHGIIDSDLGKSKKDFRKYTTDAQDMGLPKKSLTEYTVLEHLRDPSNLDEYTLIVVKLHTGRTHQIRVHMSSLGFPLVGDLLYGGKNVMKLGLGRQFLHARKIEVKLPDESWIEADSQLPGDLKDLLIKYGSQKAHQL